MFDIKNKKRIHFLLQLSLIVSGIFFSEKNPVYAESAQETEARVKDNISQSLESILEKNDFHLQVVAIGSKRSVREVVEGESITSTPQKNLNIPSLPGFATPPTEKSSGGGTNRQVFRMKDIFSLDILRVQLTFDNSLPEEKAKQAEKITRDYLSMEFSEKAKLQILRSSIIHKNSSSTIWSNISKFIPWFLVVLLAIVALAAFLYRKNSAYSPAHQPSSDSAAREIFPEVLPPNTKSAHHANSNLPLDSPSVMALNGPKNKDSPEETPNNYPPLPATESFTDRRAHLLEEFFLNSDIFRMYYLRLSDGSKCELYAGLRGPAFDSLLETLHLSIPTEIVPTLSPTEEQIAFYRKNFLEFLKSFEWQEKQFFGFLHHRDDNELIKIVQQLNPMITAVLLNFIPPKRSAKVLESLSKEKRVAAFSLLDKSKELPIEELKTMESMVRDLADTIPRLGATQQTIDLKYWSNLLGSTNDQEKLLLDIEEVMPSLYPQLAKYRLSFEDIPTLPKPIIQKIFDQVDNLELANALMDVEPSLLQFILNEIHPERRALIENQILVNQGMPQTKILESKAQLTSKFREVLT